MVIIKMEYKIDITKPPIGPPCRTMKETFFSGLKETKKSKEQTEKWCLYIEKYKTAFRKQ